MSYTCSKPGCDRSFDSERSRSLHETRGHKENECPWQDAEVLRECYHGKGMKQEEIAEKFGCTQGSIKNWMQIHGIETRDMSEANKKDWAGMHTTQRGYERWSVVDPDRNRNLLVHRLLAVAEYGFEEVVDKDVHHKKNIPWLNTPDNIEPLSSSEHTRIHAKEMNLPRNSKGQFEAKSEVVTDGGQALEDYSEFVGA